LASPKLDGVIETVHYDQNGQISWVRAYLRRGATYSDRVILDRKDLLDFIKSRKLFKAGKRIPLMASTFDLAQPIVLRQKNNHEVLVAGDTQSERDFLEGVPII
jgi:hypothetical protein